MTKFIAGRFVKNNGTTFGFYSMIATFVLVTNDVICNVGFAYAGFVEADALELHYSASTWHRTTPPRITTPFSFVFRCTNCIFLFIINAPGNVSIGRNSKDVSNLMIRKIFGTVVVMQFSKRRIKWKTAQGSRRCFF